MTTPALLADRALLAVKRLREVRERDSRVGLQQALATAREREDAAERARARLEAAPVFGAGSVEEFRSHTGHVRALAESAAEQDEQVRRSTSVADEARRRWGLDRRALRTVETLLEHRAEDRRREQARRETADLDELAAQGWLRRHRTEDPS